MYLDQRLSAIASWYDGADSAGAVRALVQIVDILADPRGVSGRRAALTLMVAFRGRLTDEDRDRLLALAARHGMAARAARFLKKPAVPPDSPTPTQDPPPSSDALRRDLPPAKDVEAPALPAAFDVSDDALNRALTEPVRPPPMNRPARASEIGAAGAQDGHATAYTAPPSIRRMGSRIDSLIGRIDAFQAQAAHHAGDDLTGAPTGERSWRADADGNITHPLAMATNADGAPGWNLNSLPFRNAEAMAATLGRHIAFRDEPVRLPDGEALLMSGAPMFTRESGSFAGYRGTVRPDTELSRLGIEHDAAADLAHEIRTPLNAILGYAQMIDQEILGPAQPAERRDARAIIQDAERMLAAINALSDAAKLSAPPSEAEHTEPATEPASDIVGRIATELRGFAGMRQVELAHDVADAGTAAIRNPDMFARGWARLATAMIAFSEPAETVHLTTDDAGLSITRPKMLRAMDDEALLNGVGPSADGDAPLLGLGFTLRILDRFAVRHDYAFLMESDRFRLQTRTQETEQPAQAS
ncbi:MAG: histidine kinase dimerization/phospho-acceptor domain-containing protein [Pseudomonadota bacterium]